jgi:ribosomal protein S14
MINKKNQQILKHSILNKLVLKYLYKNIILKSIIHNRNLNIKSRAIANYYTKKNYIKKNKKICMLTGKHRSVYNNLNLSRHNLNYFSKLGVLQNFKVKS